MTEQVTETGERPAAGQTPGARDGAGRDAAVILGIFLALGLVCGVLWWLLVDPATFTKLKTGGSMGEAELAKQFNADGWYTVIAAVAGLLAGGVLTWWRSRDFLLTTVLVGVGALIAAAATALVGYLLGPGNADAALAAARVGAHVPMQLTVTGVEPYLVWPAASLLGALMVLWSSPKDTDR
jgi:hypothetical protein